MTPLEGALALPGHPGRGRETERQEGGAMPPPKAASAALGSGRAQRRPVSARAAASSRALVAGWQSRNGASLLQIVPRALLRWLQEAALPTSNPLCSPAKFVLLCARHFIDY